jgi:hypothetical protein
MLGHQHRVTLGECGEPSHFVGELADVAGPTIEHEILHRFFGQAQVALVHLLRILLQVVAGERRDFDTPLAKRRNVQTHDIEPIVQILTEAALRDQRIDVCVGSRHNADVDALRMRFTNGMDFARFEETQQLRLDIERALADFIEKQRAARRRADDSLEVLRRSGERTATMSEQLRIQHVTRRCTAVEREEGFRGARRIVMNETSKDFLAGTGFASDQYRNVDTRHGTGRVEEHLHFLIDEERSRF